jgi:hypothetical protein
LKVRTRVRAAFVPVMGVLFPGNLKPSYASDGPRGPVGP